MWDQIQLAIVATAAILILIVFLYKAYSNISEKMAVQDCKNSITAHSMIAQGSFSEIFTDIKCPTREITIKKLDKTNEIIAEDMHRCWYIWGQGKGQYFEGEGNFCHICGIYEFSEKGKEVDGFMTYLANNDVKVKYAGENRGVKYIDYFQGYSTPNADRKVDESFQDISYLDTLNTSSTYATIFVYASGKDAIDKILESGGRTTAVTGLAMFGLAGKVGSSAAGKIGLAAIKAGTRKTVTWTVTNVVRSTVSTAVVDAGITSGAVLGVTPFGWAVIGTGVVVITGAGIYMLLDTPDPEWVSYIAFRPYNADELRALGCEQMVVNQMSNVGTP